MDFSNKYEEGAEDVENTGQRKIDYFSYSEVDIFVFKLLDVVKTTIILIWKCTFAL